MKDEQLLRLIRLAQRTGDTLIVADPAGENDIVLMDVDRYEAIVDDGLGEPVEELPDEFFVEESPVMDVYEEPTPASETPETAESSVEEAIPDLPVDENDDFGEERFYLEPIE